MKNKISAVPYAVIAPLGVLLTLALAYLSLFVSSSLIAYAGDRFTAAGAREVMAMPLFLLIFAIVSLPLFISGIVGMLTRKKKAIRWIIFVVCAVLYGILFVFGAFANRYIAQSIGREIVSEGVLAIPYYYFNHESMLSMGAAGLVVFLFSHFCMLPRIHSAAKIVSFSIFTVLSLILVPVYGYLFTIVLHLYTQSVQAAAAATLTAALPAGLVLLLMGIFMRSKQKHAPREGQPVHEAAPTPVQAPASVPAEVPVIDDIPTFDERISEKEAAPQPEPEELPHEPGMIFYARKMNYSMQTVGDWESTTWKIYQNGTVVSYTATVGSNQMPAQRTYQLNREGCVQLATLLQSFPFCDAHHNACDGEGWKMVGYTAQGDVAHHVSGYIYGVAGLEAIAEFLNNGFWEYLQKPRNAEG